MKLFSTVLATLACSVGSSLLHADVVSYVGGFGSPVAPLTVGALPLQLALPKFDASLGELTDVSLTLTLEEATSLVEVFNTSGTPVAYSDAKATLKLLLGSAGGALSLHTLAGPFAGIAAPGANQAGEATSGVLFESMSIDPSQFAAFRGTATQTLTVSLSAVGEYAGTSSDAAATFFGGDGDTYGDVTVKYSFTPIPEPAMFAAVLGGSVLLAALARSRRRLAGFTGGAPSLVLR